LADEKMNPVEYAEKVLDVHGPWTQAQERLTHYEKAVDVAAEARTGIRRLKQQIADRRTEILTEAPLTVPNYMDLNTTQKRDAIKILVSGDAVCNQLEDEMDDVQSALEQAQAEIKYHEQGLFVFTARMTELGGLLNFYAEVKAAQTAQRQQQKNTTAQAEGEQQ
jgi:hypothetical protein